VVLIPIAFAFLIAFILFPVARKFESWGANEIVAAFLAILCLFLIIGGAIFLFSNQIIQLSENLTDFKGKILDVLRMPHYYSIKTLSFYHNLKKESYWIRLKTG
jgi:predicted PurR-regulated permease PerM